VTWLYEYAGIGIVFVVLSMAGNSINEPWHVRACVYVGLVALWPLVFAVELYWLVRQRQAKRGTDG
jgi:hypothetical protein